jgi:putative PIN family toxin of toxin-antitoxin system
MMRIVLDTNVLVSGLLTPFGTSGDLVRFLTSDEMTLCVDSRILIEYEEELGRERFRLDWGLVAILMEYIRKTSELYSCRPLSEPLPDPDDCCFLEVALAARADCLVTGNIKHFPPGFRQGVRVLTPAEFLNILKKR